mgnify:CR=1 FL=1
MNLLKNKKAQYARAMRRQFASQDRAKRLYMTNYLLKKGHSIPDITISLGVSSDTICKYVSEINADKQYFDQLYKEQEASIIAKEKEDLRRKNRSLKEILIEELPKSFALGLLWTIVLYLFWWIPGIISYMMTQDMGITNLVWGNPFWGVYIVTSLIVYTYFVLRSKAECDEYHNSKKKKKS